MQNTKHELRKTDDGTRLKTGSAFILAVVMTSLLAIIGVMFLMAARVEKISTSAISENKELNLAVDSIIAIISRELAADLPGEPNQEYYDYPDVNNAWLASFEPYLVKHPTDPNLDKYYWRQISDVTGYIKSKESFWGSTNARQNVPVKPPYRKVIREYPDIKIDPDGKFLDIYDNVLTDGQSADADGDGIADSKWIQLADITTNKGKPIYAAIRIIDNGAMLNINTSYEFDPNGETNSERIDGSSQTQINLAAVARENDDINDISLARCGISNPTDEELLDYQDDFIWQIENYDSNYTPFDISDELELRYRYCINSRTFNRIENAWQDTTSPMNDIGKLYNGNGSWGISDWQYRIADPCDPNDRYNSRHLLTYYNMDRIIDPNGYIMLNINIDASDLDSNSSDYSETKSHDKAEDLYDQFTKCIDQNFSFYVKNRMREKFAQLAVNIVDLCDHETNVTYIDINDSNYTGNKEYIYGLEPHPVITKVAIWIDPNDPNNDANGQNYYAVELFNPFDVNIPMTGNDFVLLVTDYNDSMDMNEPNSIIFDSIPIDPTLTMEPNEYYVIFNIVDDTNNPISYVGPVPKEEPNLVLSFGYKIIDVNQADGEPNGSDPDFVDTRNLVIRQKVEVDIGTQDIYVDRQLIYKDWTRWDQNDWVNRDDPNLGIRTYQRDFEMEDNSWWYTVYHSMVNVNNSSLGKKHSGGSKPSPMPNIDIAMPWDSNSGYLGDLVTVGDISRIWAIGPHDYLFDPLDMNEPNDANGIYDPNTIDPNDPNDPNDANSISRTAASYSRTLGETLKFVSRGQNYKRKDLEELIRLNLADADYRNLFQYITVFDPNSDNIDNDGDNDTDEGPLPDEHPLPSDELKIPGRININTAPWYVIAQLPWMREDIAKAIVAYRDKLDLYPNGPDYSDREDATDISDIRETPGFESIGELATVINDSNSNNAYSMHWYALDSTDINSFPDLTLSPDDDADGAEDDFEERDIIFSRISNLVTVRSDVYTAYILVRIGTDGPQKRYIAIFDRSDAYDKDGFINVIAAQQVPDPR